MKDPKISIIFPTFNGWQDTKACLSSILKLNYPLPNIEIIIIDNASVDDTPKNIRNFLSQNLTFPRLSLITNSTNLGFAKAVNLGIQKAKGELLLITNNDVIFDKNYLKELVLYLSKNPMVGIIGGKVYYKKPKNKIAFPGARFGFYTGILHPNKTPNQIFKTDWIPGCNLLVRRSVLEMIGHFDTNFFFYFEDLDLCLRTRKAGYEVIYYPKAIMYHGEGISIDKEKWQIKSQYYYEGKTRILFKHATIFQLICSLLFQFTLGLLYQLFIIKHQNYFPAIKALFKSIKNGARNCHE